MPNEVPREPVPPGVEVARVSIKTPPFWKANPALWFCQLVAQFEMSHINVDRTKYNIVVAAIESSILNYVGDIVLAPPQENMYITLKKRLLEQFTDSEQTRLKKLLSELELGEKRPSQLLREMRTLGGTNVGADLLRSLLVQRLPMQVQVSLATSNESLDQLAVMADKISEVTAYSEISEVNAISPTQTIQTNSTLENQIEKLTRTIAELQTRWDKQTSSSRNSRNVNSRSATPSRSVNRSRSRSRSNVNQSSKCWYHSKYGAKATKCRQPCNFSGSSDSGNTTTRPFFSDGEPRSSSKSFICI